MNLLDKLPNELIDYIYSYDDNVYWKSHYKKSVRIIEWSSIKNIYITYLSNMHHYYDIYQDNRNRIVNGGYRIVNYGYTQSKYILYNQKHYGDKLIDIYSIMLNVTPSKLEMVSFKNPIYKE